MKILSHLWWAWSFGSKSSAGLHIGEFDPARDKDIGEWLNEQEDD